MCSQKCLQSLKSNSNKQADFGENQPNPRSICLPGFNFAGQSGAITATIKLEINTNS